MKRAATIFFFILSISYGQDYSFSNGSPLDNHYDQSVSVPSGDVAKGYDKHIDVMWDPNPETNIIQYNIYRFDGSEYKFIGSSPKDIQIYTDFLDSSGFTKKYKVSAVNSDNVESELSSEVSASTMK